MKIGIIGTGTVGRTLAAKLAEKGHQVLVANTRGLAGVRESLGSNAALVTPSSAEDVAACEIVFLAVPWTKVREVLDSLRLLGNRILVDTTNIFLSYPPDVRIDDLKGDSGSEIIARLVPEARVVKAFNTLPFATMFAPLQGGMKRVLFVAGDDALAISAISGLTAELGLHPVTLGSLAAAGRQMELGGPLSSLELLTPWTATV